MVRIKYALIIVLITIPIFGQEQDTSQIIGKPPINGMRVVGESLAGTIGGITLGYLAGIAGVIAGIELTGGISPEADEPTVQTVGAMFVGGVIGGSIGYLIGTTAGVYLVGNLGDETGSLKSTFVGSIVGGLVGFGTFFLSPDPGGLMPIIGPPIGATIGFNMTRRYKNDKEQQSPMEKEIIRDIRP